VERVDSVPSLRHSLRLLEQVHRGRQGVDCGEDELWITWIACLPCDIPCVCWSRCIGEGKAGIAAMASCGSRGQRAFLGIHCVCGSRGIEERGGKRWEGRIMVHGWSIIEAYRVVVDKLPINR
jgi:hypothetical protein